MNLALDPSTAEGYSSKAQRSRVITETWAANNLYCLNCSTDRIQAHRPNKRVEDFLCPSCDRRIQLKAARGGHSRKVSNSAYGPKIEAIEHNRAPDYAFMGFDPDAWRVNDLFLVPGHFMTPTVIEKRNPLSDDARRSGWVGSNILLDRIPTAGRIKLVHGGEAVPREDARSKFEQTAFLAEADADTRDWTTAVMDCIDELDVEQVENVAPAIESFETKLSQAQDRVARTDQRKTDAEEALSDLRDDKSELEKSIADAQEELETADVETIDEFRDQVESREDLTANQRTARQSLVDRFGEPSANGPMAKADSWEEDLDDLIEGIDLTSVDADTYDEAELDRLETEVEELQSELNALQDQLQDHDDQLDKFDRRARALNTQPFIGQNLTLEARSREGLESLASDLDRLVQEIEKDAELSRKALEIFSEIEEREEEKLTDLFDPDGPASRTLEHLTDGRYTEVAYDAETHDLVVERRDGRTFNPRVLSQGTKDQLYFATRVSLAEQLLGNEPGFLLLDDPFLAADPERLIQGFETLLELADDGWQIFYFTAKQEVSETMVEEFSLEHEEMDPIQIVR